MMEHIITYISITFSFFNQIFLYKLLRNKKVESLYKTLMLTLIFSMISLTLTLLNIMLVSLIINLLLSLLLIKYTYNISWKESFYFSFIISFISMIFDSSISIIVANNKFDYINIFKKNIILRCFLVLPVFAMSCIFTFIPGVKKVINFLYDKLIDKRIFNKRFILLLIFVFITFISTCCLNIYNSVDMLGHIIIIFITIILLVMMFIILYFMYKEFQIEQCNKIIIEENNYIKEIAKQDEIFKHNLVNNLLSIKTIGNEKVNKLIDALLEDYQHDYKNISNINDLPNGIQSIIYRKAYKENIENLHLLVENVIKDDLYTMLTPKNYNYLCTSIGILFDNAIEAVKDIQEKIIKIEFNEDNEYIFFVIQNSYENIIDLEEIGIKKYTNKKNGHGIGLNYIMNLKCIILKNELINNLFVTKLKIKKNNK